MTNTTAALHISHVYPVARAFGFGEPVQEESAALISGATYGITVFAKDGLEVTFYTTDGVVDEVGVARGQSFLATSESDAAQVGLQALAGVDVIG